MKELVIVFFGAILVDNFILSKFMGICPFLGVSKKLDSAAGMGIAVMFVMLAATVITYPVYIFLLYPDFEYLRTIAFILIIALFVQLAEMIIKKHIPVLYKSLGIYLPLITTNCAVLGVTVLNIDDGHSFLTSVVNSLGAGFGFMMALLLFSGIREKIENSNVPESFRGMPIALVSAAIMCVAFLGFGGIVQNIFS